MTDEPQPEYCDCPGFHDGSCHARQIAVLHKKNALLRAEVRVWRAEYSSDENAPWSFKKRIEACMAATDAAGALEES